GEGETQEEFAFNVGVGLVPALAGRTLFRTEEISPPVAGVGAQHAAPRAGTSPAPTSGTNSFLSPSSPGVGEGETQEEFAFNVGVGLVPALAGRTLFMTEEISPPVAGVGAQHAAPRAGTSPAPTSGTNSFLSPSSPGVGGREGSGEEGRGGE